MQEKKLQDAAIKIAQKAYSPYSNFQVGAALLCSNGEIVTGVNVENSSFGLSVCAERNAICSAITMGHSVFSAIAIHSPQAKGYLTPCGACRQTLVEFMSGDTPVYISNSEGEFIKKTLEELLPYSFHLDK